MTVHSRMDGSADTAYLFEYWVEAIEYSTLENILLWLRQNFAIIIGVLVTLCLICLAKGIIDRKEVVIMPMEHVDDMEAPKDS